MNSKERKNGNGKKNTKRHLKNWRIRLQVNQYLYYLEEKENSEWRQIHQDMQLVLWNALDTDNFSFISLILY